MPHPALSNDRSCSFFLQVPQRPCVVRKWFSGDHCCRGRSKSGSQIAQSSIKWELTTEADLGLSWLTVYWLKVSPQQIPGWQTVQCWAENVRVNWPVFMAGYFVHQLIRPGLPSAPDIGRHACSYSSSATWNSIPTSMKNCSSLFRRSRFSLHCTYCLEVSEQLHCR